MKSVVKKITSLGILLIGIYMMLNYSWPTPPFLSGLAFILIAIRQCGLSD